MPFGRVTVSRQIPYETECIFPLNFIKRSGFSTRISLQKGQSIFMRPLRAHIAVMSVGSAGRRFGVGLFPAIISRTERRNSMKFCTMLIGQERTVPFDFRRIPSTFAPSSGDFIFSRLSYGCLVSDDYFQNGATEFNEILHNAYWSGEGGSFRFPANSVNLCAL